MRIAIVDDEETERNGLRSLIEACAKEINYTTECSLFDSGESFLSSAQDFDLIFLDIYMNGYTGIETARKLQNRENIPPLVFLTTSSAHYPEAFEVHAFDYISKPASKERIKKLLSDLSRFAKLPSPSLTLPLGGHFVSVPLDEILFVTSDLNYLVFCGKEEYRCRMTFSSLTQKLAAERRFVVVNKGILVNLDHVLEMEHGICMMDNHTIFPLSRRKAAALRKTFLNYQFEKRTQSIVF